MIPLLYYCPCGTWRADARYLMSLPVLLACNLCGGLLGPVPASVDVAEMASKR